MFDRRNRRGDSDAPGRSDANGSEFGARAVVISLLVVVAAATCSAAPKPKPDEPAAPDRPIRPDEKSERVRFEEALTLLESANYEQALREFRLIQSEQPEGSSSAQLAELYIARASMGSLGEPSSGGGDGRGARRRRAMQLLAGLYSDTDVDARVRRAATLYWAFAQIRGDSRKRALQAFAEYPDARLGSAVLKRDRAHLWPVLVDGLHFNSRWADTLRACAQYYDWRIGRGEGGDSSAGSGEASRGSRRNSGDASETTETDPKRSDAIEFARSRAFHAASKLSSEEVEQMLDGDGGSFVRAAAGWAYLDAELRDETLSEKQRRNIDDRFQEIAAELNSIGASGRVSELSLKLATLGGSKRLVIGAILPLSGADRSVGERAVSGMLLAMRAFRHRGPARVTLVFQDSNDAPRKTMQRLADAGAAVVVGPLDRGRASKFAPVAADLNLPLVTLTAASLDPTGKGERPFVFRNFMSPVDEARAVAHLAFHEYGDRRAAVAFPDVGYGRRVTEAFTRTFRKLGGEIVASVSYDRGASDFSNPAAEVASAEPDAVFIPDSASNVAELTAFLAQEDIWGYGQGANERDGDRRYVHYLGTSLWYAGILTRQAGQYVRGATIPAWYAQPFEDDPTRTFGRRFRGVFDRKPSNIEAFAYDNVRWLRTLIVERGLQDPTAVRDALLDGTEYRGATGAVRFDDKGRMRRRMRFITVREQSFQPLSTEVDLSERLDRSESGPNPAPPSPGE